MSWILTALSLIPFYLLGSLPTGRIVAKQYGVDIEKSGSGNIGATNVARTIGKKAGIITLLIDIAKGYIGVVAAGFVSEDLFYIGLVGITLVLGHCFSVPPKFKGGKGVATGLGVIIALAPQIAAISLAGFVLVFAISRYVSLGSICAALVAPAYSFVSNAYTEQAWALALISFVIVYRHKENIKRLIQGSEPRFK